MIADASEWNVRRRSVPESAGPAAAGSARQAQVRDLVAYS